MFDIVPAACVPNSGEARHDIYGTALLPVVAGLADDVIGEGAFMEGVAQGAEAVRSIVVAALAIYEGQEFSFTGDYGDNGFLHPRYLKGTYAPPPPSFTWGGRGRNTAGSASVAKTNVRRMSS